MIDPIAFHKALSEKAMEEDRIRFSTMCGFNDRGETYIPCRIEDDVIQKMKKVGAEYNRHIGYHTAHPVDGVEMGVVQFDEVCEFSHRTQKWHFIEWKCKKAIERVAISALTKDEQESGFVGEVNERVNLIVSLVNTHRIKCDSEYGDVFRLSFKTVDNNFVCWLERNYTDESIRTFIESHGSKGYVRIVGTVQRHVCNRGCKTTYVKNCVMYGKDGLRGSDCMVSVRKKGEK